MSAEREVTKRPSREPGYNRAMSSEDPGRKPHLGAPGDRVVARIDQMEARLLREFRFWAIVFESHFRANEAVVRGFSERMVSLEERVSGLERRDE